MSRRSISVKGTTYERIKRAAALTGQSVSDFVEVATAERCAAQGIGEVDKSEVPPRETKPDGEGDKGPEFTGSHFTF